MQKKILIIIPCYNEAENIVSLLSELALVNIHNISLTALPINDKSKDDTLKLLQQHANQYLNLTNNLGIGGAVQSGIKYALKNDFDYAIQMDGDGQHPPSELSKLIEHALNTNCDICLGSRYINYQGFQSSAMRRVGIKILNFLIQVCVKQKVYDSTSGYRVFNKKAIELFSSYYPDKYPEPEVIVYAKLNGLTIEEIPVFMRGREGGESSIGGFSSLYYMLKVSLAILFLKLNFIFTKK